MARLAIGVTVSILSILPVCMSQFELPPGATPVPTNPPGIPVLPPPISTSPTTTSTSIPTTTSIIITTMAASTTISTTPISTPVPSLPSTTIPTASSSTTSPTTSSVTTTSITISTSTSAATTSTTSAMPPNITPSPQTGGFSCVPIGTCPATGSSVNGVDIRITIPVNIQCPAGQIPCVSSTAGGSQCGVRYVQSVSLSDGNSTQGAFPWQVFLSNQTQYIGSGVLIDQNYILTAAHKVDSSTGNPGNIRIALGVWDPSSQIGVQNRTAVRITIHPNFDKATLRNDIAVVRLNTPVTLGNPTVGTACLPAEGDNYVGRMCVVSGWGQTNFTSNDAPIRPQKQINVPIVSYNTCRNSYLQADVLGTNTDVYLDPVGELCAGGQSMKDACTFDGGAPLACPDPISGRFTAVGLVIWGKGCGRQGVYGVYVNLATYRSWINLQLTAQ